MHRFVNVTNCSPISGIYCKTSQPLHYMFFTCFYQKQMQQRMANLLVTTTLRPYHTKIWRKKTFWTVSKCQEKLFNDKNSTFHSLLVPYSSTLFEWCMPNSSLIPLIDYNPCNNITSKSWIHQCFQSLYPRFGTSMIQLREPRVPKQPWELHLKLLHVCLVETGLSWAPK